MIACLFLWPQRSFSSDSSSHSNFLLFFSQSFKLLTLELRHHLFREKKTINKSYGLGTRGRLLPSSSGSELL